MAPEVLPVGIVTALAGAPFFLWVLRRTSSNAR
jgi:ABC-type Fe3+-siderophore transport system permease subunit